MAVNWSAVSGAVLAGMMALATTATAQPREDAPATAAPRVRAVDDAAKAILEEARRRSASVRSLLEAIEASDLLVYVLVSSEPGRWRGDTRVMGRAGAFRMVSVRIHALLPAGDRIPLLAHELQHVLEIAGAPEVVDSDAMRKLFGRIGYSITMEGNRHETEAAQAIEHQVRKELTRAGRQPN